MGFGLNQSVYYAQGSTTEQNRQQTQKRHVGLLTTRALINNETRPITIDFDDLWLKCSKDSIFPITIRNKLARAKVRYVFVSYRSPKFH